MTEPTPLPMRILLPVANPATAEELVRVAASLLDPKAGTLTALGIVEVPEEMPLSEGAARARQARRLLQRVLEYCPPGTRIEPIVRIGRRAADGILEVAAEEGSDLVVFGWAGTGGHGQPRPGVPPVAAAVGTADAGGSGSAGAAGGDEGDEGTEGAPGGAGEAGEAGAGAMPGQGDGGSAGRSSVAGQLSRMPSLKAAANIAPV